MDHLVDDVARAGRAVRLPATWRITAGVVHRHAPATRVPVGSRTSITSPSAKSPLDPGDAGRQQRPAPLDQRPHGRRRRPATAPSTWLAKAIHSLRAGSRRSLGCERRCPRRHAGDRVDQHVGRGAAAITARTPDHDAIRAADSFEAMPAAAPRRARRRRR